MAKYFKYLIIPITWFSVQYQSKFPIYNLYFWWTIQLLTIWYFGHRHWRIKQLKISIAVTCYIFWMLICIIRGVFVADGYWDWKYLMINSLGLLLPATCLSFRDIKFSQSVVRVYFTYMLPLFLVEFFILDSDVYGFYLIPISIVLPFLPMIKFRWRMLLLGLSVFVIFYDLGARSNILKFGIPVILSLINYSKSRHILAFLTTLKNFFFLLPFVFLFLGYSGLYNVFDRNPIVNKDFVQTKINFRGESVENYLGVDTRTFLYNEVFVSALQNDYIWLGRTPARGNDSESFGEMDLTNRNERNKNEVGVLNVFTHTGVIGLFLYLMVFYTGSSIAIQNSSNLLSKILGLFLSIQWALSWVENINEFTLNYLMVWLLTGLCYSSEFRNMNDVQVKNWIKSIFR